MDILLFATQVQQGVRWHATSILLSDVSHEQDFWPYYVLGKMLYSSDCISLDVIARL